MAQALIEQDPGRLDERATVVAFHWERAGRRLEAAKWNLTAGTWLLRSDLREALRRWELTTELLESAEDTDEAAEVGVQARIRLLQFGARAGIRPENGERLYREARRGAERLGRLELLFMIVATSGAAKLLGGEVSQGLDRLLEAAHLAEGSENPDLQAVRWYATAWALGYTGPLDQAREVADRAVAACGGDPDRGARHPGYSPLARALTFRAAVFVTSGYLDEAKVDIARALSIARPRAEAETVAWTLALAAKLAWLTDKPERALAAATEAVALGEQTGNIGSLVLGLEALALAYLATRQPVHALAAAERGLREAHHHGVMLQIEGDLLMQLAEARLATHDPVGAGEAARAAVEISRNQKARVVECAALIASGHVQRKAGVHGEAATALTAAITLARDIGAVTYESFIHEELGWLHADEKELGEALLLYRQIGATGRAHRLEAELSARTMR